MQGLEFRPQNFHLLILIDEIHFFFFTIIDEILTIMLLDKKKPYLFTCCFLTFQTYQDNSKPSASPLRSLDGFVGSPSSRRTVCWSGGSAAGLDSFKSCRRDWVPVDIFFAGFVVSVCICFVFLLAAAACVLLSEAMLRCDWFMFQ